MLPYYELLYAQGKGTLVLWKEFDILSKSNDDQVYDALNSLKDVVANHLSLIFHRYMTKSKHQISFYVNNQRLKAFDPFLESHPKTTCLKEKTIAVTDTHGQEQHIRVKPFVLPYLSDMSDKDKKLIGGIEEMRTKQGFYVYRNERLIIWGSWFGMSRRNELTKNARIRVDIPNALDDIWSIDIKKQVAKIPKRIQNQLTKMVNDALGVSVNKQTYRGRKENIDNNIDYIWDRIEGRDKTYFYKINRKNKLLEFVFSRLNEAELEYIDILLTEIEHNIPMQQIYIDKSNNCVTLEEDIHRNDEIFETAVTMIDVGRKIASIPVEQLIENLMKSEPFCLFKDVKGKLIKHFSV